MAASLTDARFTPAGDDLLINAEVARHYSQIFDEGAALIDPAAVLNVRYEGHGEGPATGLRAICDFLGLGSITDALAGEPAPAERIPPLKSAGRTTRAGGSKDHSAALQNCRRRWRLWSRPTLSMTSGGWDTRPMPPKTDSPAAAEADRAASCPSVSYRALLERLWRWRYGDIAPFVLHTYPSLGNVYELAADQHHRTKAERTLTGGIHL